jgi:hypothetical protein
MAGWVQIHYPGRERGVPCAAHSDGALDPALDTPPCGKRAIFIVNGLAGGSGWSHRRAGPRHAQRGERDANLSQNRNETAGPIEYLAPPVAARTDALPASKSGAHAFLARSYASRVLPVEAPESPPFKVARILKEKLPQQVPSQDRA